jgi:hypothetical protein
VGPHLVRGGRQIAAERQSKRAHRRDLSLDSALPSFHRYSCALECFLGSPQRETSEQTTMLVTSAKSRNAPSCRLPGGAAWHNPVAGTWGASTSGMRRGTGRATPWLRRARCIHHSK